MLMKLNCSIFPRMHLILMFALFVLLNPEMLYSILADMNVVASIVEKISLDKLGISSVQFAEMESEI